MRDRTALKNREKNLTVALLKRQCAQRLDQIARHITALDAEIAITAVMRKLVLTANALLKADRIWTPERA